MHPSKKARLDAMVEEAIVDCYNEYEQATGLFTMIADNLAVPSIYLRPRPDPRVHTATRPAFANSRSRRRGVDRGLSTLAGRWLARACFPR